VSISAFQHPLHLSISSAFPPFHFESQAFRSPAWFAASNVRRHRMSATNPILGRPPFVRGRTFGPSADM